MAAELHAGVTSRRETEANAGLEVGELVSRVRVALAQLPPRQATAVLLRVLEDRPYDEIASAMGCSSVTARIHVMRGRAGLSRLLAPLAPQTGGHT